MKDELGAFGEVAGTRVTFDSFGVTEKTTPSEIVRLLATAEDEVIVGLVMFLTSGTVNPEVVRGNIKRRRELK